VLLIEGRRMQRSGGRARTMGRPAPLSRPPEFTAPPSGPVSLRPAGLHADRLEAISRTLAAFELHTSLQESREKPRKANTGQCTTASSPPSELGGCPVVALRGYSPAVQPRSH